MHFGEAINRIQAFIRDNSGGLDSMDPLLTSRTHLDSEDPALKSLISRAIIYLSHAGDINSVAQQKEFLNHSLIPIEKASSGKYSFVLEHDISQPIDQVTPTIQISTTSGRFHALVIRRQDKPLEGYDASMSIDVDGVPLQVAIAKERVKSHVDLEREFPQLHHFRQECAASKTPIVYFLGGTRQFLDSSPERAAAILEQTRGLDQIFSQLERDFGNNIVIGTGGWAGTREKSLGIPRMGYLRARASGAMTLTTMPHTGKYDRHRHTSYEVFCGEEWGDDSAALAATCDAAVLFRPFGTWTNIELANLQAQDKLVAVVDNPRQPVLAAGENRRRILTEHGSYWLFAHTNDAAQFIIRGLQQRGFEKAKTFNFASRAGCAETEAILQRNLDTAQCLDALKAAHMELLQNLGKLPDGATEQYFRDISDATTANNLFLIVEEYIAHLYHGRGNERT